MNDSSFDASYRIYFDNNSLIDPKNSTFRSDRRKTDKTLSTPETLYRPLIRNAVVEFLMTVLETLKMPISGFIAVKPIEPEVIGGNPIRWVYC